MKQFAELIATIDHSNKTNVKVNAMADYFNKARRLGIGRQNKQKFPCGFLKSRIIL